MSLTKAIEPAFRYWNDPPIELLRATMNLPLLHCDDATY